jgi:hypothetical protein
MKKRLLLIFAVGVSFSPSLFADVGGTGNAFNKSQVAGQIHCAVLDGDKGDLPDSGDNIIPAQQHKSVGSGVTLSQNSEPSISQSNN